MRHQIRNRNGHHILSMNVFSVRWIASPMSHGAPAPGSGTTSRLCAIASSPNLGKGCVIFFGLLRRLGERGYKGYVLVEQDIQPGMGTAKESALRNLAYLCSLETKLASATH